MSTIDIQIQEVEAKTIAMLKDFQRATVERIDKLYWEGQKRVLVADEVGLGKTLIARGVIAKMTKLRYLEDDPLFKVVYVCSNQNIARQNIRKLDIFNTGYDDIAETRLSMQHLKAEEQEIAAKEKGQYIELIPLTPQTSFRVTQGAGSMDERALMFSVLSFLPEFQENNELRDKLNYTLQYGVKDDGWAWRVYKSPKSYTNRVLSCKNQTSGSYPDNVLAEVKASTVFQEMMDHLSGRLYTSSVVQGDYTLICKLRRLFAEISVGRLNPDLVIMDEFQRFRFLIENQDIDSKLLTDRFLTDKSDDVQDLVRVLLLSATPYKLYSTPEEIQDSGEDSHYTEFMSVMKFLLESDAAYTNFKTVWSDYSHSLRELSTGDVSVLSMKKNRAEDAMYACICRTERNSVMESGDYIDDGTKNNHLYISEGDILAYLDVQRILDETGLHISLPVDYVKSCPYILSFMQNYEAKKKLTDYFRKNQDKVDTLHSKWLWLNKMTVNKYKPLPTVNARFERLKKETVDAKSALLLWVPPTRPYYAPQGPFKGVESFSKVLVFSAWEMVPKMVASLLSYEAERLAIGKLGGDYFAKNRSPQGRLTFKLDSGRAASMTLLSLVYPNKTLADLYNPIEYINAGITDLKVIEKDIREKIRGLLAPYRSMPQVGTRLPDKTWYLVPMLFDGKDRIRQWSEHTSSDEKGFNAHKEALLNLLDEPLNLGKEPDDLVETIVNMVLGSPAVCCLRAYNGNTEWATELAKVFRRRFNTPDATAIVELAYNRRKDDDAHWQDVLHYCKDGNFQSMLDEYFHLIKEGEAIDEKRHRQILDALTLHTASPEVESFNEFKARISGDKSNRERKMRSNYAVAFGQTRGEAEGVVNRKDSIQGSFNSPMRPFVLATTSIGQEGLDFHLYCRKIMHWNLPSNPVELEQREGRINRFKCLAIRENVIRKYGNIQFKDDIWQEMFEAAEEEKGEHQSDLIPFWCFGNDQVVKIERLLPFYPMSRDEINYSHLIKILNYYRLTLGQPRQEELLEYVFNEVKDAEKLKQLFINLSPFSKKDLKK